MHLSTLDLDLPLIRHCPLHVLCGATCRAGNPFSVHPSCPACRIHHDTRHLQGCTADLDLDSSSISPPCTLWYSHLRRVQACTALRGKSKLPAVTLLQLVPSSHSSPFRARGVALAASSGSYRFHLAITRPRSSLEVYVRHATRARGRVRCASPSHSSPCGLLPAPHDPLSVSLSGFQAVCG